MYFSYGFSAGISCLEGIRSQDTIGLYSINRIEWILAEYAAFENNLATVPLYDTLGDEAMEYILEQTEMKIVVVAASKVFGILFI